MNLEMHVENVKCINNLTFSFPLENGLYAITGENGSGKSTLIACGATVFFNMPMKQYLGKPQNAKIEFSIKDATRSWKYENNQWSQSISNKKMSINGFYEGSIIFGNRFKNAKFSMIEVFDKIKKKDLIIANEFVRRNLGLILHDDENYYKEMFYLPQSKGQELGISAANYFCKFSNNIIVSQVRMSTGENLLISILHSLSVVCKKRKTQNERKYIVFLDEIELALHSAALRRLVLFLKKISEEKELAIFFSTHSIELLREIKPQNIFYLNKNFDDSIRITNPCYPAYATRNLYSEDGYGNDLVILVEDDLAKLIIEKILFEQKLINNIRIKVLPTGGWSNTITMAFDIISSNLLLKNTKLLVILDRDVEFDANSFVSKNKKYSGIKYDFLPIPSLEKYIRSKLVVHPDDDFINLLDNYVFQKKPLTAILSEYKKEKFSNDDYDGKSLYGILLNELRSMRKDREELVDKTVNYIMDNEKENIKTLYEFLKNIIQ